MTFNGLKKIAEMTVYMVCLGLVLLAVLSTPVVFNETYQTAGICSAATALLILMVRRRD